MNLEFTFESDDWNQRDIQDVVNKCVNEVFAYLKIEERKIQNIEICFLFATDDRIRELNNIFRGKDSATNVLSFPAYHADEIPFLCNNCDMDDDPAQEYLNDLDNEPCILGSIACAYETIVKEANEQNKVLLDHVSHLIVHGLLHLLGFDHVEEDEAEEMENTERQILAKMNIADPYKEAVCV